MHDPDPDADRPASDQRTAARLRPLIRPTVRLFVAPHYRPGTAVLRDLSVSGAGLLVRQEVLEGAVLLVQLSGGGTATRTQLARVVRRTRLGAGWLLGCVWLCPLGEDELGDGLRELG
jgi:hypothetical protein